MRPYSHYLENMLAEKITVKHHLAGSTPPLPTHWRKKTLRAAQINSSKAPFNKTLLNRLAKWAGTSADRVALCPGGSQCAFQVLAAVTSPGEKILIEFPVYEPFVAAAKFLGLKVVHFRRTGDFAKDLRAIKAGAKGCRRILISNPHCPTGQMYTGSELHKISKVRPLIVDEVFLPLFDGGKITRVKSGDIISMGSFSKSLGLGSLRVGWVIADKSVQKKIRLIGFNMHIDMPSSAVQLAELASREWQPILRKSSALADKNRELVTRFIDNFPAAVPFGFEKGFFFMLKVPKRFRTGHAFAKEILKHGAWIRPGEDFSMPGFVRIHVLVPPKDFAKVFSAIASYY